MTQYIEIQWTSGSLDEARKIARFLVQERMAASAQIIPWIESIYMWNNQLETSQESSIIIKSTLNRYKEIEQVILQNCKYQVPEILFRHIEGGSEEYLKWIEESTGTLDKSQVRNP